MTMTEDTWSVATTVPATDALVIAGRCFTSRLFLGTGRFNAPMTMTAALEASGTASRGNP